jgi:hypothetical protein
MKVQMEVIVLLTRWATNARVRTWPVESRIEIYG